VYLIVTLRPKEEPKFINIMELEEKDLIKFRDTTIRTNVAYKVIKYDVANEDEVIIKLVERKKKK